MADIITRLILKNEDWDKNLKKAKESVNTFESGITNMASKAGAGIMKFAGTLGIALTAVEGFDKIMKSSQTLSDEYAANMDAAKESVDQFFYSIANGDWSNFTNGLRGIIDDAKEAYAALDSLGNARISFGYFDAKNQAKFADALTVLKDKDSTEEAKSIAKKQMEEVVAYQQEMAGVLKNKSTVAIQALVAKGTGLQSADVSMMDVDKILSFDISSKGEDEKSDLAAKYKEYQQIQEKIKSDNTSLQQTGTSMYGAIMSNVLDKESYASAMAPVLAQYQDAIMYNSLLVKKTDEELQNITAIAIEMENAERAAASMEKSMNRATQVEIGEKGVKTKADVVLNEGSTAKLQKEISDKRIQLSLATNHDDQVRINKELNELVEKKRVIEFQYKFPDIPDMELDDKRGGLSSLKQSKLPDFSKIKAPKFAIKKEDVNTTNDYLDSLTSVANVMTAINTANVEGAAGWLSWAASLMTATGTAIESIRKVVAAKTAETASSGAAEAAKTPFVGWMLVGGAIASILAAMSSIPKFETGGIVGGSSFSGDKLLARVNSGEMVLNVDQQKSLFAQLSSPSVPSMPGTAISDRVYKEMRIVQQPMNINRGSIVKEDRDSRVEVNGNIKLSGKDIYIAVRNAMKSNNLSW